MMLLTKEITARLIENGKATARALAEGLETISRSAQRCPVRTLHHGPNITSCESSGEGHGKLPSLNSG